MEISWIRKLLTREVRTTEEISGIVTEREFFYRGILRRPVTIYTVVKCDGNICRVGIDGHRSSPAVRDRVEMYLEEIVGAYAKRPTFIRTEGGSMMPATEVVGLIPVKRYKILS